MSRRELPGGRQGKLTGRAQNILNQNSEDHSGNDLDQLQDRLELTSDTSFHIRESNRPMYPRITPQCHGRSSLDKVITSGHLHQRRNISEDGSRFNRRQSNQSGTTPAYSIQTHLDGSPESYLFIDIQADISRLCLLESEAEVPDTNNAMGRKRVLPSEKFQKRAKDVNSSSCAFNGSSRKFLQRSISAERLLGNSKPTAQHNLMVTRNTKQQAPNFHRNEKKPPSIGVTCASPPPEIDPNDTFSVPALSPTSTCTLPLSSRASSSSSNSSLLDIPLSPSSNERSPTLDLPPLKGTPKLGRKKLPPLRQISPVDLLKAPISPSFGLQTPVPPIRSRESSTEEIYSSDREDSFDKSDESSLNNSTDSYSFADKGDFQHFEFPQNRGISGDELYERALEGHKMVLSGFDSGRGTSTSCADFKQQNYGNRRFANYQDNGFPPQRRGFNSNVQNCEQDRKHGERNFGHSNAYRDLQDHSCHRWNCCQADTKPCLPPIITRREDRGQRFSQPLGADFRVVQSHVWKYGNYGEHHHEIDRRDELVSSKPRERSRHPRKVLYRSSTDQDLLSRLRRNSSGKFANHNIHPSHLRENGYWNDTYARKYSSDYAQQYFNYRHFPPEESVQLSINTNSNLVPSDRYHRSGPQHRERWDKI